MLGKLTKNAVCCIIKMPSGRTARRAFCYIKGGWLTKPHAESKRGEVMRMGCKHRAQLLRVVICVIAVHAIALYFAPTAC